MSFGTVPRGAIAAGDDAPPGDPAWRRVVLIGLDGARPDLVRDHAGPALSRLIRNGTVCWQARAVEPSVTQVNWPSMLTGSMPEVHGITRQPVHQGELDRMRVKAPSIFDVAARHGQQAVAMLGHWKLYTLRSDTPGARYIESPYESGDAARLACQILARDRPDLLFVYMGDLDGLGHRHGWMSPQQIAGLEKIDAAIGMILDTLDRSGLIEETVVVVSSDHGGQDRSHSPGRDLDVLIPWIACGPGIRRGHTIVEPFSTTRTAATVLSCLRIPRSDHHAPPVDGAFSTEHE